MGPSSWANCCGRRKSNDKSEDDFEKLYSCKANGLIPTTKYVSKSTGFTVIHAQVEGPIVHGYICIATQAQNDDGLPHTLEHLTFLGSENYPYPGVLDRLANKCLASGTNAWVDVDHTCFTLRTAGSEGFCQLLPIYLDHVFYPLLTDAAFKTEVYHITRNGKDAGVVYSEMQATENSSSSNATTELFKTVFPPQSGYSWVVGGVLSNLRESCSNEKVRAFHKKFYHPQNACLVVGGMIEPSELFASLSPILQKWNERGNQLDQSDQIVIRPWLTEESQNIPDVSAPQEKTVFCPSSDEEGGCLAVIGILGPAMAEDDLEDNLGVILLLRYLTKSTCSPLGQELVENVHSLASSLDFSFVEYRRTLFYFELEGVKVTNKNKIVPRLRKAIQSEIENFNAKRMITIIKLSIQAELSTLENEPFEWISEAVIQDFLYSNQDHSTFKKRLNTVSILKEFLTRPMSFWTDELEERLLAPNWVAIFAEPSIKLLEEFSLQEEVRISTRIKALGKAGLERYAKDLEKAISQNSRPIPPKVLKRVKVPSLRSMESHKIHRIQNPSWISNSDFPANLCLDNISTSFVYVSLVMDTSSLDDEFRSYLPLFKEVILNSPIKLSFDASEVIPYEEVVARRDRDLQVCAMNIGIEMIDATVLPVEEGSRLISGNHSHLLTLVLQMELDKVERGMDWIRKILWTTRWKLDRIKVAASKMVEDIHHIRRLGSKASQMILKNMIYLENTNAYKSNLLHQLKFLMMLGAEDDEKLAKSENDIRTAFDFIVDTITDARNVSLHIAANITRLREKLDMLPCGNLGNLLRKTFPFEMSWDVSSKDMKQVAKRPDTDFIIPRSLQIENASANQLIFGLGSEESSYLIMVAPGPSSFMDPEIPALLTTLQYFTQLEGPLYKTIRGGGYAYGYTLEARINEGLIYFKASDCSDVVGAYAAVLNIIQKHFAKSSEIWTTELLVSAKSSLIFECLETEKTPLSLASNSCLYYYRDVPGTYNRDLISKIGKVTLKDLKRLGKQYVLPLFQNQKSNFATVIVCPTDQVKSIQVGLAQLGKVLHAVESFDLLLKK